jgi:hypothetical protein
MNKDGIRGKSKDIIILNDDCIFNKEDENINSSARKKILLILC